MALFGNLFGKPGAGNRRHERLACEKRAELYLTDRLVSIHGMVIEMSRSGALFREAARYILERRDTPVLLRIGGLEFSGTIVNSRSAGYGILFDRTLSDEEFRSVLAEIEFQPA